MFKKWTPEQQEKWDYVERKISNWFWGIVAISMILYGLWYQGGL